MRRNALAALALGLSAVGCGQALEPLAIAELLFGKDSVPDMVRYVADEYDGRPNGQGIAENVSKRFLLLGQNANKAVVALTLLDSLGRGVDMYLHFRRDTSWRITAVRGLAMTGFIQMMVDTLEAMPRKEVNAMIKAKRGAKDDDDPFSSKKEFDRNLGNYKLTLALDDDIIKHFKDHRVAFERVRKHALAELKAMEHERRTALANGMRTKYRKLFISSVSGEQYRTGPCLDFLIGGMVDNSVGYLYVERKEDVPEMDQGGFIMIREIGGGWYIYKTT